MKEQNYLFSTKTLNTIGFYKIINIGAHLRKKSVDSTDKVKSSTSFCAKSG